MGASVRRGRGTAAGIAGALLLAACGSGSGDLGPGNVHGRFPVAVSGHFSAGQRLAQRVTMRIAVRNTGRRAVPDIAVTICNRSCAPTARPDQGTAAQAFGHDIGDAANLANPSRPLWIVNRGPGACHFDCNAPSGGGGVTANSNTWALGRLAPGRTARFTWVLTPVVAGRHRVAWEIAGNLTGTARAVARRRGGGGGGGGIPHGTFAVSVSATPPHTHVTPAGKVLTTPGG